MTAVRDTRKLKVPRSLLDAYNEDREAQNFFIGIEDRDLIGELYIDEGSISTATSVALANGTVVTGDVDSTKVIDGTYYQVQESGQFEIDFTFTGIVGDPARIEVVGRYEGNPAHNVEARFYNYNTTTWDEAVAATGDFPSSATDYDSDFDYPTDSSDYISGGEVQFRIIHTSASNINHDMYIDYIALTEKTEELTSAGTFYVLDNLTEGCQHRTELSGTNGTITIKTVGKYRVDCTMSFLGTADTKFSAHIFVNGTKQDNIGFARKIGTTGDVGSAAMGGCLELNDGDVVDVRVSSLVDDTFIAIEHLNLMVKAIN